MGSFLPYGFYLVLVPITGFGAKRVTLRWFLS
jgi:hypothetical protein